MNQLELDIIVKKHGKWLRNEEGGECADLQCEDLQGVFLYGANLQCANLQGANLRGANLQCANLRGANLQCANLQCASLHGANLHGANFDFSCWPLWCGSLGVKGDEKLVGQLAYHLLDLIKSSGVVVESLDALRELANKSSPVANHFKEKV
jgi:hypothetical protein